MAMLEVFGKRSITIYEVGDAGKGVELGVRPLKPENEMVHEKRYFLKFGNRFVEEVPNEVDDPMNLEIGQALSAVGEPAEWDRVTLNGSIIWESAAVLAARAAIAAAKKAEKEAAKKAKEAEKEAAKKAKEEAEKEAVKKVEEAENRDDVIQ